MASLCEKVIAYLNVNSIAFANGDFKTIQPNGQGENISFWNTGKLGAQPSQATLDAAPIAVPSWLVSKLTIRKRIRAAGLEAAFNTALGGLGAQAKNDYGDAQAILSNDPNAIALLNSIGADPAVILAPDTGPANI